MTKTSNKTLTMINQNHTQIYYLVPKMNDIITSNLLTKLLDQTPNPIVAPNLIFTDNQVSIKNHHSFIIKPILAAKQINQLFSLKHVTINGLYAVTLKKETEMALNNGKVEKMINLAIFINSNNFVIAKKTEKEKITEKDLTFQLPSINNEIIDTYTIITNKVYKLNDIEIKKPFAIKNKKSYSHYLINNEMNLEIKNKIKLAITIPKKWSKNTSKKHNNFSTKNLKKNNFSIMKF